MNGGIYQIGLKATELINGRETGDSTTTNATFVINDINDQIPFFNLKEITLTIPEDIANDSAIPGLNLVVSDSDIGDNARFELSLQDLDLKNPATAAFSVTPAEAVGRTPVILKVINSNRLDFENEDKRVFEFNVVAHQSGVKSYSRVTLKLSDANDHHPVFDSDQYHFQIPESIPSNVTFIKIIATDADSGEFGTIRYYLKGFGSEKFNVNEQTGELGIAWCMPKTSNHHHATTSSGLFNDFSSIKSMEDEEPDESEDANHFSCLDYESQPSYSLTYEARDGGGKRTTVNLFIEVLDVNDNPPIFAKSLLSRELYEKDDVISPPLILRATDADGPNQGGNQAIRYFLKSSNLTGLYVDPVSGEVKLTQPIRADFSVSKSLGVRKKLNYEATIKAVDGGDPPLESEARIIFSVRSERDGAPVFINEPYNVSVKENAARGSSVIQVKATDPDGPDSALRYAIISGAKDNFVMNELTGEILVSSEADLDRDVYGHNYKILITVKDAGLPLPLTSTSMVEINIDDVNDKPPKFASESYVVYCTDKQLQVGHEIIKVSAHDTDLDAKLRYSIEERGITVRDKTGLLLPSHIPNVISSIRLDPISGSLKISDRMEHIKASVIVIPIVVTDLNAFESAKHPQKTMTELTIYIQSENEKNPVFASPWTVSDPNYVIQVPEETVVGASILTLTAKDSVTNMAITEFEKIKETDPENYFSVSPLTGIVTLNKRIDFEEMTSKQLKFSVKAIGNNLANKNKRPTSVANIIINVQDINDFSPQFSQDLYTASVLESAQWPQTVLTVIATDRDSGDFGSIMYSISGDGSHLFEIDAKTGTINIRKNVTLDREVRGTYNLQVTATDNYQAGVQNDSKNVVQRRTSVLVRVSLIDVNDNRPVFEQSAYDAIVPENVPIGFVVGHVKAFDKDESQNGQVIYEIMGFEESPERLRFFAMNKTTGVITVANHLSGKGRREPYPIDIRARDSGKRPLFSDVTFSVTIGDISANDGIPVFIKPAENEVIAVVENSKPGTFVYQVEAVDPDNPNHPNGKVMYKFLEPEPYFEIDPLTGIITTATDSRQRRASLTLDREVKENFTLILVASDLGIPPQEAHRVIFIHVNDTDDNEPYFKRAVNSPPLEFEINEEQPVGSEVAKIKAIDEDIGLNARVVYEIINGNEQEYFYTETSPDGFGLIKVRKSLDRETDEKFLLTIRAQNVKKSNPKSIRFIPYDREDPSHIQVQIKLRDVDDHLPRFENPSYVVGVKYTADIHSHLMSFKATDPDVTQSNIPMIYYLSNAQFIYGKSVRQNVSHVFDLDPTSGLLRNELPLRSFVGGHFNLTISAKNNPAGGRESSNQGISSSDVNCKVFILRDKDFFKFVFKKRPNDIRKELKNLETDFGYALAAASTALSSKSPQSDIRFKLNFDETQFLERNDGSLDFESASACFQLIRTNGKGNDFVLDFEEGLRFLRSNDNSPYSLSLRDLYSNYSIVSVEECVPGRVYYRMSSAEVGILLVGVMIAVLSMILICIASRMKRRLKKRLLSLGLYPGVDGQLYMNQIDPYGVPPIKTPSFISLNEFVLL